MLRNKRILFILKKRSSYGISYGLTNSCKFVANTLNDYKLQCKVVEVEDYNCIDKEVHSYKPSHVFIDALWVLPEKFKELLSKYKKIYWCVRIHSKMPFLSMEGIAMQWLWEYQKDILDHYDNFDISANSLQTSDQLKQLKLFNTYLPNMYYPHIDLNNDGKTEKDPHNIDIGCFGSIRPLKNQLQQAVAAILFADDLSKKMRFHINADRVEQKGEPILKNLEYLFENSKHKLIKHDWMNHEDFLKLVSKMELGMQVSYSESFNIVAADFAFMNIPIVGSYDIDWLNSKYQANPNDCNDIVDKLKFAYENRSHGTQWLNKYNLWKHNKLAVEIWLDYILG